MDGRLSVGLPDVFAGSKRWATSAATFADLTPPEVTSAWPSAIAVGSIHVDVTTSHAAFGARLLQTAARAQAAGVSYSVMDAENNAPALNDLIGGATQS